MAGSDRMDKGKKKEQQNCKSTSDVVVVVVVDDNMNKLPVTGQTHRM